MAHSLFAPSSAHRTISCPASLLLNEKEPDVQNSFAAEGTAAHFIGELALSKKCDAVTYAGCTVIVRKNGKCEFRHEKSAPLVYEDFEFEVTDEMCGFVQEYVDRCNAFPGDHYTEQKVNISNYTPIPEQYGTADHVACSPGVMHVGDLKYGMGVKVFAEDNEQALLYALGVFDDLDWAYDFQDIYIHIYQPRLDHWDTWHITRDQLIAWGVRIRDGLKRALEPDPPFNPTVKNCTFCKIAGKCRALAETTKNSALMAFDDETLDFVEPDLEMLSVPEMVEAWHMKPLYDARMSALTAHLERLILKDGVIIPGLKVVEGLTHRKWISEQAARAVLELDYDVPEEKLFKKSMITPAQAQKLLPKDKRAEIDKLFYKPAGGPAIVRDTDKRKPYNETILESRLAAFDDESDEAGT